MLPKISIYLHSSLGFSLYFHSLMYLFSVITKETKGWTRIGFLWKVKSQRFYQISREVFSHIGNFQCNSKGLPEVLKFSTVCHKMDILLLIMLNIWVSLKYSIQVLYSLSLYVCFGELLFHIPFSLFRSYHILIRVPWVMRDAPDLFFFLDHSLFFSCIVN